MSYERNPARHNVRYDRSHKLARARWRERIRAGRVICPRCNEPISRYAAGDEWDLGHQSDGSASRPEHAACNRATSAHAKADQDGAEWQPRAHTTAAQEAALVALGRTPCPRGGQCPWPERTQPDGSACACPTSLSANPANRWWDLDDEPAPFESRPLAY